MKKRVLVVGSANMDLTLNVFRMPAAGETVIDDGGVAYVPGGKGANAAMAFKKLGAESIFCGKLGADVHGQKLYNYYREAGIDTSSIKVDHDYPTGFAAVIRESEGQNRIICYPGANANITSEHILQAFARQPDAVYTGFEIGFPAVLATAKIAATKGVPVFIDAAPANKDFALESLPCVEVFSPNETETFEFTGIMPEGADSSLRAALALWRRVKCKYIVIKQGQRGACIYDGKHFDMIPACRPEKLVDTTAAGDTFTAALTIEYLKSGDIKAAARYATVAAAIAISRTGASSSVPTEEEVKRFIQSKGF